MPTGRPHGGVPRPPSDIDPRIRRAIDAIRNIAESVDAINSLVLASSSGILVMSSGGAFEVRSVAASNAGLLVTNGNGTAGNMTISLADDTAAIEALSGIGVLCRTASNAWSLRQLTAPAAGITIANNSGTSGNPTFALANDLNALESLASTGLAARTGADTWAQRTITATSAGLTVGNGNGVSGNPSIGLADDLATIEALSTTGMLSRTGSNTWSLRTLTGTANQVNVINGDGTAGNPTFSTPQDIHTGATMTLAGLQLTGSATIPGGLNSTGGATLASITTTTGGGTIGSGTLSLADGVNLVSGTSAGTKLATSATQKLSFWNATPIMQPASANQAALTDSTTGSTAATTIVNVDTAGVADASKINDNFARVVLLLNQLRSDMVAAGLIKGSA